MAGSDYPAQRYQQNRAGNAHRIRPWEGEPRERSDDQAREDERDDEPENH